MRTVKSWKKAWVYFCRAMVLRCPVCGVSRIFPPLKSTRSLRDWFTPLDGCPRCGYAYEREPGYFLLSIWAINYGFGSLLGIAIYVGLLIAVPDISTSRLLWLVLTPVVTFNLLFVRHSKALFLAFDHFFDPHKKEGGDDGGNKPRIPVPPAPTTPRAKRREEHPGELANKYTSETAGMVDR